MAFVNSLKFAICTCYTKVKHLAWKFWIFSILGIAFGIFTCGVIAGKPKVSLFIISEDINEIRLLMFRRAKDGLLHPEPVFTNQTEEGLVNINPHLDLSKETKILIHGWKTSLEYAERFIQGNFSQNRCLSQRHVPKSSEFPFSGRQVTSLYGK